MTVRFDISSIITKSDVDILLESLDDRHVSVSYNTGDTEEYDRNLTSDSTISESICSYISRTQASLNEMMNDPEPDEEMLDAMYRQYLAEQDSISDAEEAFLHHYCA